MLKRVTAGGVRLFLVDDVSPEDAAGLMALYARHSVSVEVQYGKVLAARRAALTSAVGEVAEGSVRVGDRGPDTPALVDAVMQVWSENHPTSRAQKILARYRVGFGHASIADCGFTALFVEGGSMVLAKALQDTPLYCGQEMSSRAVDCGEQPYVDPVGTAASSAVLEGWRSFYKRAMPLVLAEVGRRHPRREGEDAAAYGRAVEARAFDVCRGFLPFGCATQVGWSGTLRHLGDRLGVLVHHPSAEVREVAAALLGMCRGRYPDSGFDGGAAVSGVGPLNEREEARAARAAWTVRAAADLTYSAESDGLQEDLDRLDERVLFLGELWGGELFHHEDLLASRPRGALLPHVLAGAGQVHFDFPLDAGSWRDLQRQRAMVVRPALLTARHGFEPWYLEQLPGGRVGLEVDLKTPAYAGFALEAARFVEAQAGAVEALTDDPVVRQYYLGLGFRMRCRVSSGLPGVVYALELRSGKAIHPTLRRRVLEMARLFRAEYPGVALHVDEDPDDWSLRRAAHGIVERADPGSKS